MIKNTTIQFESNKSLEFRDLTDKVENFIKETKIKDGNVLIYSTHTTLAICVNEKEKGIVTDFKNLLNKLIPKDAYYCHNDLTIRTENLVCQSAASDCLNGHSHCTHLLMRNSETIPVIDGKLMLGVWQKIFAIELDSPRPRKVLLQVIGE
ncbi:MAG: secondary thiamine-phosphate synthase enzyme YjbQ [Candidatus Shapirobacteria bacterium]|jgi:secondary thiamine-phosphate synthase enzyme|nr:secondary thiamine-phosphate synthase enzyme YjbQ [Candidatus Shapirobacteria bacterium]